MRKLVTIFVATLIYFVPQFAVSQTSIANTAPIELTQSIIKKTVSHQPATKSWTGSTLWKIEKIEGTKPIVNYIFGTEHLPDARVSQFPANLVASLNQVNTIILEVVLDSQSMQHMMARSRLDNGDTLDSILSARQVNQLKLALNKKSIPYESIKTLKPWLLATQFMLPTSLDRQSMQSIEVQLQSRANLKGLHLAQLETVDEQLDLFDHLPKSDQVDILMSTVEMADQLDQIIEQLMKAYLSGDLLTLTELNDKLNAEEKNPHLKQLMLNLVQHRNHLMVQRMQRYINQGDAMVAVGALHLPGEEGLLSLLQQDGWKVTPVTMTWH